jgi:hypothetical protein
MATEHHPTILLTGGTGYVGGRLVPLLEQQPVKLRCLARHPDKQRRRVKETTEVIQGDVLNAPSLDERPPFCQTARGPRWPVTFLGVCVSQPISKSKLACAPRVTGPLSGGPTPPHIRQAAWRETSVRRDSPRTIGRILVSPQEG